MLIELSFESVGHILAVLDIMLNEVSKNERDRYRMISLICGTSNFRQDSQKFPEQYIGRNNPHI